VIVLPPFDDFSGGSVCVRGPKNAQRIDTEMVVEATVLDAQHRLDQKFGKYVQRGILRP
jgi:hypothetical protein